MFDLIDQVTGEQTTYGGYWFGTIVAAGPTLETITEYVTNVPSLFAETDG